MNKIEPTVANPSPAPEAIIPPAPTMAEAAAAQAPALAHADAPLRRQAIALMRDCLQQANARALARHDHFDDADDLAAESA